MDDMNSREYYRARALASRKLAQAASDPQIARIHENFACHYEDALASFQPKLRVVVSQ